MSRQPRYLGPLSHYRPTALSMSYIDYLQAREFSDCFLISISEQTKDLITHSESLLSVQVEHLEKLEAAQRQSTIEIVQSLRDLQRETAEGFTRVGSVLEWGFSEILVQAGRTNDLLSDILDTLKHQSRTWAYEQFERAREEYRKGLFAEALYSLDLAVAGFGSNVGFRTEYRFHYLRGIIKLGSLKNSSPDVVDPAEAEAAFLFAGKYAEHDFPGEAANAQLCAARAANVQGGYERAAAHCDKGLSLAETAGLHFERAKALASLDRPTEAKSHLHRAIRLDKRLVVASAGDPYFTDDPSFLEDVFSTHLREVRDIAVATRAYAEEELMRFDAVAYRSDLLAQTFELHRLCPAAAQPTRESVQDLAGILKAGGILDIRATLETLPNRLSGLAAFNQEFRNLVLREIRGRMARDQSAADAICNKIESSQRAGERRKEAVPTYIGMGVTGFYILVGLNQCSQNEGEKGFFSILGSPVMGGLAWGIAAVIAWVVFQSGKTASDRERERVKSQFDRAAKLASAEESRLLQMPLYSADAGLDRVLPAWARGEDGLRLSP